MFFKKKDEGPKIVGGVKYVYNIDNPHKFKVVEIDLGKDKGFWG